MTRSRYITDAEYFEKSIITRALKYPSQRQKLRLDPEHFHDPRHRELYRAIREDSGTTAEDLLTRSIMEPEKFGEYDFVQDAVDFDIVTEKGIVADQKNLYRLYTENEIMKLTTAYAKHPGEDIAQELADTIRRLSSFTLEEQDTKSETLSNIWDSLYDDAQTKIYKTGLDELDAIIDGFEPQQLNIIAARPAMGKTAFAIEMALRLSVDADVTFCSLEMSEDMLTRRILSNLSKVDAYKFKKPTERMTGDDIERVLEAIRDYHDTPVKIKSGARFSPADIRTIANNSDPDRMQFIIIDYLQLMKADGRPSSRFDEVSEISRDLKIIAQEFENVTIIALSQLSRAAEGRQDKRPGMSDLRESGQIEQDAHIIMMLYRDDYYNPPADINPKAPSELEVIVAKNRDGTNGTARLQFYKGIQRIY